MQDTETENQSPVKRNWLLAALPLIVFLVLAAIFLKQLGAGGASRDLPSALIGREAPLTDMEPLAGLIKDGAQVPAFHHSLFAGKVSLVNIWSSWCVPCRQEHPLLVELGKSGKVQIIGLNYKDKNENALRFLGQLGNPFDAVGVDPNGRNAIEWGVYGVPESFIVGPDGKILYKQIGPISPQALETTLMPIIEKAGSQIK